MKETSKNNETTQMDIDGIIKSVEEIRNSLKAIDAAIGLKSEPTADSNNILSEVVEWEIQNNGGEQFKFFIDEDNRACFNVRHKKVLLAGLIMTKKEFEELVNSLNEMMKNVKK